MKFVGLANNFYEVHRSCELSRNEKKLCKVPKICEQPYEVHGTPKQLVEVANNFAKFMRLANNFWKVCKTRQKLYEVCRLEGWI